MNTNSTLSEFTDSIIAQLDRHPLGSQLGKELGKNVFLAPDMDREGEAIAFHLSEEIGRRKGIHRVVFNAVTNAPGDYLEIAV